MSFSILVVCTGNICRSPVGERLLRARLADDSDVLISSAGTYGLAGFEIDQPSALALRELGVDPSGHRARRLDVAMLESADLVLTATAEHRRAASALAPAVATRTFTLREFARVAAGVAPPAPGSGPEALRAQVALVAAGRATGGDGRGSRDDVADPFGASIEVARACAGTISAAVDGVLAGLGLGRAAAR